MEEGGSSYFLALMPLRVAGAAAGVFGGGYKGREPVESAPIMSQGTGQFDHCFSARV